MGSLVALVGTSGVVAEEAGVANTMLTPLKKPPMGARMEAESSLAMGWYTKRGSGSS